MHKIGQKLWHLLRTLLVLAGIIGLSYLAYWGYQYYQFHHNRPSVVTAKDGTNTNAAWHSLARYQQDLRLNYSFINKASNYVPPRTWAGKDFVIPGLVTTKAYNFVTKKWDTATCMTPQGIAFAGHYLLLSAYDGTHQHASVIYVLNKRSGRYLKTVQVRGRPHLGGLAYDPVAKNIWLTGNMGKSSALMSFSLASLKKYRAGQRQPIRYNHQIAIPALEKASTIAYYDDQLFVGFFNMLGRGKVASYPLARSGKNKGSVTGSEIKTVTGSVAWSDPSGETTMDKQIQGIAIYQGKIFLSQSYGSQDSKLYIFPTTALTALNEKNAERVISLPPYLEQIVAYKGQLLCVFESASKLYAKPEITVMDRILSLNINALFGV